MRKIQMKNGFTLVELIVACAIISIFFVGTGAIMGGAAKAYIQETSSSGARGAIETAVDDIKNYLVSGKDIKMIFYMDGTRNEIVLDNGTKLKVEKTDSSSVTNVPFVKGTIFYADGSYEEPDGTKGKINLTAGMQQELEKVAEGVDLGYKKIYVKDGTYIQGLPYSKDYYRGMKLILEITRSEYPVNAYSLMDGTSPSRSKEQKVYSIRLTGKGKDDIYTVEINTASVSMNDSDYK